MKRVILMSTLFIGSLTMVAQPSYPQVISTSGSFITNGTISLSTTIGEPVILTYTTTENVLTQGFQQPCYDTITGLFEISSTKIALSIYPNPTEQLVNIELHSDLAGVVQLMVVDIWGRLVYQQDVVFNKKNILDLNYLASGQYFLRLTNQNIELGTYKIQKIN